MKKTKLLSTQYNYLHLQKNFMVILIDIVSASNYHACPTCPNLNPKPRVNERNSITLNPEVSGTTTDVSSNIRAI